MVFAGHKILKINCALIVYILISANIVVAMETKVTIENYLPWSIFINPTDITFVHSGIRIEPYHKIKCLVLRERGRARLTILAPYGQSQVINIDREQKYNRIIVESHPIIKTKMFVTKSPNKNNHDLRCFLV